jgi:hypothetical protein
LLGQQETLERVYGGELAFEALEGRRAARIAAYSEGDVADTSQHEVFASWFIDSGRRLRRAIGAIELP